MGLIFKIGGTSLLLALLMIVFAKLELAMPSADNTLTENFPNFAVRLTQLNTNPVNYL
jgi:hypothetical protein